jgi:hypothetical protein
MLQGCETHGATLLWLAVLLSTLCMSVGQEAKQTGLVLSLKKKGGRSK